MIHSILDTDLYKFTTSYAYIKLFPYAKGTFSFTDRDDTVYTDDFLEQLKASIGHLAQVALTPEELEYMTAHCASSPASTGSGSPPSASTPSGWTSAWTRSTTCTSR